MATIDGWPANPGCDDWNCTRIRGLCIGMHCAICGKGCGSQGHAKCQEGNQNG